VTAEKEWVLVTKRREIKFRPIQRIFKSFYAGWPKKNAINQGVQFLSEQSYNSIYDA
jgi:hypothetical protein